MAAANTAGIPYSNRLKVRTFFSEWTESMAYVLGFFAADGCMYHSHNGGFYNGGYYIEFTSTDKELVETIKNIIDVPNRVEIAYRREEKLKNYKRRYKIRIVNKAVFEKFLSLGFTPAPEGPVLQCGDEWSSLGL